MNAASVSLLLAVLGGLSVLASWLGLRIRAAAVPAWVPGAIGGCLLAAAAALFLVVAAPGGGAALRPLMQ